jgi:hypothetical protein
MSDGSNYLDPNRPDAVRLPESSFKVINALAMAASYDPDPTQFLGIRLPVTFDTCEVTEERWANWLRQDPVVAIETQADNLRRLKALYIDCGPSQDRAGGWCDRGCGDDNVGKR